MPVPQSRSQPKKRRSAVKVSLRKGKSPGSPKRVPSPAKARPARTGPVPPSLEALFRPASVAVVGATERAGSVGRAVLENLRPFPGAVYPVNPSRARLLGRRAWPRLEALPEVPDLVVIVVPAIAVPGVVRECAALGVPAAIIISAGFRECGAEGAALERAALDAARGRVRLLGPNCLGVMTPHHHFNATFAAAMARPGSVACISQSGALCTAILDWSLQKQVGFSAFVSIGAMADIGWGDLIDYLGDDPHTKSIVCYMESAGDARAFLSAAREVAFRKPIVVLKVGNTAAGAQAAASHTGSMTGSDEVASAAFARAGVLRVHSVEQLFDMAEVLAKQPRPTGPALAIVTNAGGPAALASDQTLNSGARLAELSPETLASLNQLLPAHWSHGNPVDLLGAADGPLYARAADLVLADERVDGLLVVLTPQAMTQPKDTAEHLAQVVAKHRKPVLASWMGGAAVEEGRNVLNAAGIPTYDYPDAAARAFAFMWQHSQRIAALYERPTLPSVPPERVAPRQAAGALLGRIRATGRTLLTEIEAQQILSAYDVPVVPTIGARSEDEAVKAARRVGFPVVLKLWSETLTHKARVGGVRLNLGNAAQVRAAWRAIRASAIAVAGAKSFSGVVVQPMVANDGIELIVGSTVDPQFGPVMVVGAGGSLVEVLGDRALALPPLNATLTRRLLEQTRIFEALAGKGRREPVDLARLEEILVHFSRLVVEQQAIAEIDVNPLLVSAKGAVALDARIVLHPPDIQDAALPRLAIRPYPTEYVRELRLPGLGAVTLRPIRPEDETALIAFHRSLSSRSVHERYFGNIPLDTRIAHPRLARICFSDYDREITLVAERRTNGEVVAVGRINKVRGANEAEFALLVGDPWQGHGLGQVMLEDLISAGRREGLARIFGTVLAANTPMQRVCRKVGFRLHREADEIAAEIVL